MGNNNLEIAQRLKAMREMLDFKVEDMLEITGVTKEEYLDYESGNRDFSVTFLFNCAEKFGIDVSELLVGSTPKLSSCAITRAGQGVITERRHLFTYEHLAHNFKGRSSEPFFVTAPYEKDAEDKPIILSAHNGQEMDYVLSGQLKVNINGRTEILNPGDTAYYDSSQPHGMIAVGGKDCTFLAVVLKPLEE